MVPTPETDLMSYLLLSLLPSLTWARAGLWEGAFSIAKNTFWSINAVFDFLWFHQYMILYFPVSSQSGVTHDWTDRRCNRRPGPWKPPMQHPFHFPPPTGLTVMITAILKDKYWGWRNLQESRNINAGGPLANQEPVLDFI